MNIRDYRWMGKTQYYGVYLEINQVTHEKIYRGQYKNVSKYLKKIKDAAKFVDMKLIFDMKEPKNILKKVPTK